MMAPLLRRNHGTVLVVAMLLMTTLAVIGIAVNMNVVTDTGIASNYLSSLQSFYMAEAGLERARVECAERFAKEGWHDFNAVLRGADNAFSTEDDGILSFGSLVSYRGGHYAVRVVNEPGDAGGQGTDTNATITIVSRGSSGHSTTTLKSTIAMTVVPHLPGSVNLVGHALVRFANNAFYIDGRDYRLSDTGRPSGTSAARLGISISDVASPITVREQIVKSLTSGEAGNIVGSEAAPSVGISAAPVKSEMGHFIDVLRRVADTKVDVSADTLHASGPENLITSGTESFSLGTASSPKVTYLSKKNGGVITLNGQGCGILIIEGNGLIVRPNIHYTGMVILTGNGVALDDSGNTTGLQLTGGLVVMQSANNHTGYDLNLVGKSSIRYSREAMDMVGSYLTNNKKHAVISWQRSY